MSIVDISDQPVATPVPSNDRRGHNAGNRDLLEHHQYDSLHPLDARPFRPPVGPAMQRQPAMRPPFIHLPLPGVFRTLLLLSLSSCASTQQIPLDGWTALVDPATLSIRVRIGTEEILVASGSARLSDLGLTAQVTPRGPRLHIRIESTKQQTFDWPRTGLDPQLNALILPEDDGLFLPRTNAAWCHRVAGRCYSAHGNRSLPLWAFHTGPRTITYDTPTDIRTELCLQEKNNRLEAVARHQFLGVTTQLEKGENVLPRNGRIYC